jgi:hypothetical protein
MKKVLNNSKKSLKGAYRTALKDVTKNLWISGGFVVLFVLLWVLVNLSTALLWTLFLSFAWFDWDNRIVGVMGLFCIALCPFFIQFKHDDWAEVSAVYAWFFLVITVGLQLIEYKRHPERFEGEE